MNIYQRINEVRKAVSYIVKNKTVGEGGYKAVTHDAVTALTRDHMVAQGIVVVPYLVSQKTENTGTTTSRGTPFIRFEAVYNFGFVNVDDPKDVFLVSIAAHAIDQGDKAPGKALSYAKKYAMLKVFELESGEEEEDRPEQFKPKILSGPIKPSDGAVESLQPDRKQVVMDTLSLVLDALHEDRDADAFALCESLTDPDEKVALWAQMGSKDRARIKAQRKKAT